MDAIDALQKGPLRASNDPAAITIHNFCDWTLPGGSTLMGKQGQEEAHSALTNLRLSLKVLEDSYKKDKVPNGHQTLKANTALWSPDVLVCSEDHFKLAEADYWYYINAISAPAPICKEEATRTTKMYGDEIKRYKPEFSEAYRKGLRDMLTWIMRLAVDKGSKWVVLGAWGCDLGGHPPQEVAEVTREVIVDGIPWWDYGIDGVIIAIPGSFDPEYDDFAAFHRVFDKTRNPEGVDSQYKTYIDHDAGLLSDWTMQRYDPPT